MPEDRCVLDRKGPDMHRQLVIALGLVASLAAIGAARAQDSCEALRSDAPLMAAAAISAAKLDAPPGCLGDWRAELQSKFLSQGETERGGRTLQQITVEESWLVTAQERTSLCIVEGREQDIGAMAVVAVRCVATYTCDGTEIVDAGVANCRQMR